jgi:beta-galactosidase
LGVIAYRQGWEIARRRLATVDPATSIRLQKQPFGNGLSPDRLTVIASDIVDNERHSIAGLEREIAVTVECAGQLLAFGSASPLATGSYQSGTASSWQGRALVNVRGSGKSGNILATARGQGLEAGHMSLRLG